MFPFIPVAVTGEFIAFATRNDSLTVTFDSSFLGDLDTVEAILRSLA